MRSVILATPGSAALARTLHQRLDAELGACEIRSFPDGEWYLRIDTPLQGAQALIVCGLERPDTGIVPLLFMAATARDLGAVRVGLIAPYLAYMRQDRRFRPGEGITSIYFASLVSRSVDWLVTVEPHLHRWSSLEEIYTIPTRVARAAPGMAAWIRDHVSEPLLVGPDAESAQWVTAVAELIDAPYMILEKIRRGDHDVEVSRPDPALLGGRTPVIIDDIISTARTMIEPVRHLLAAGSRAPVCVGVHAIFTGSAYQDLLTAGAARVVTCNTIAHETNAIAVDDALAASVRELMS